MATDTATAPNQFVAKIDYNKVRLLLAEGYDWDEIAPKVGAKNANSLRASAAKKNITKGKIESATIRVTGRKMATTRVEAESVVSEVLKDELNRELLDHVQVLRRNRVKNYAELPNDKQGRTSVVKTIAESFRAINGAADQVNIVFGVGVMRDVGDPGNQSPAVDVQEVKPGPETGE